MKSTNIEHIHQAFFSLLDIQLADVLYHLAKTAVRQCLNIPKSFISRHLHLIRRTLRDYVLHIIHQQVECMT